METKRRRKERMALFLEEVWSRGELGAAGRYIAERHTICHNPGDPRQSMTLDREAYKDRVRRSREPMPDQRFDVQEMFADRGAVIVSRLWRAHSHHTCGAAPSLHSRAGAKPIAIRASNDVSVRRTPPGAREDARASRRSSEPATVRLVVAHTICLDSAIGLAMAAYSRRHLPSYMRAAAVSGVG